MNQILESQQTPHTSPSRASYGVSFVKILEKTDRVITAPHCKRKTNKCSDNNNSNGNNNKKLLSAEGIIQLIIS